MDGGREGGREGKKDTGVAFFDLGIVDVASVTSDSQAFLVRCRC